MVSVLDSTLTSMATRYQQNRTLSENRKFLQGYGLTPRMAAVLKYADGISPLGKIADTIGFSQGNLTTIIKQLEAGGFVKSFRSPEDDRPKRVARTQKGNRVLDELRKV